MIQRIINRLKKERRNRRRAGVPYQAATTFREDGNQWYEPVLTGPSTFVRRCSSGMTAKSVLDTFNRLSSDKYLEFVKRFYSRGIEQFGDDWTYADISTVLYGLCSSMRVESYLEIGVRRGRSMSIVASLAPDCRIIGFDLWVQNYAGMENPGAEFVRGELAKVGYRGDCQFVAGNSKKTVPAYLKRNSTTYFDLVTVDGDHSRSGAAADIRNVAPRIKIGGAIVFDDICNPEHAYLLDVWKREVNREKGFIPYAFMETGFGVAFAIREW